MVLLFPLEVFKALLTFYVVIRDGNESKALCSFIRIDKMNRYEEGRCSLHSDSRMTPPLSQEASRPGGPCWSGSSASVLFCSLSGAPVWIFFCSWSYCIESVERKWSFCFGRRPDNPGQLARMEIRTKMTWYARCETETYLWFIFYCHDSWKCLKN